MVSKIQGLILIVYCIVCVIGDFITYLIIKKFNRDEYEYLFFAIFFQLFLMFILIGIFCKEYNFVLVAFLILSFAIFFLVFEYFLHKRDKRMNRVIRFDDSNKDWR